MHIICVIFVTLVYSNFITIKAIENLKNCGTSVQRDSSNRIIGGREALKGEYPWQVSLQKKTFLNDAYYHYCGGSILNNYWIITAAHCLDGLAPGLIRVVAGAHEIHFWSEGMTIHNADKFVINAKFSHSSMLDDIGLIKLREPIDFEKSSGLANSVCLPDQELDLKGMGTVSGWGQTYENGEDSNNLMTIDLPIVTQTYCQTKFGLTRIQDTVFCAGSLPAQDSCLGDSGGPMVQYIQNKAVIIGLVSYGNGCGKSGWPGVYTEVSKYLDWIDSNMKLFV